MALLVAFAKQRAHDDRHSRPNLLFGQFRQSSFFIKLRTVLLNNVDESVRVQVSKSFNPVSLASDPSSHV
jgi:hypothetical protein